MTNQRPVWSLSANKRPQHDNDQPIRGRHGLTDVTALGVGEREERPLGVVGDW